MLPNRLSERDSRVLDSPEHRRLSEPHSSHIAPPRFILPHIPASVSAASNSSIDPFAAPRQPAILNGHRYNNLPAELAAQVTAVAAMAPMPAPHIPAPVPAASNSSIDPFAAPGQPAVFNGQTYNNLPAGLAAQMAAVAAMAPIPAIRQH